MPSSFRKSGTSTWSPFGRYLMAGASLCPNFHLHITSSMPSSILPRSIPESGNFVLISVEMQSKSTNSVRCNSSKSIKYVPIYLNKVQKPSLMPTSEVTQLRAFVPADMIPLRRNQPTPRIPREAISLTMRLITLSPR